MLANQFRKKSEEVSKSTSIDDGAITTFTFNFLIAPDLDRKKLKKERQKKLKLEKNLLTQSTYTDTKTADEDLSALFSGKQLESLTIETISYSEQINHCPPILHEPLVTTNDERPSTQGQEPIQTRDSTIDTYSPKALVPTENGCIALVQAPVLACRKHRKDAIPQIETVKLPNRSHKTSPREEPTVKPCHDRKKLDKRSKAPEFRFNRNFSGKAIVNHSSIAVHLAKTKTVAPTHINLENTHNNREESNAFSFGFDLSKVLTSSNLKDRAKY